ncbi:MAG: hypothetical protein R2844_03355 [Caldilineales bacterium]
MTETVKPPKRTASARRAAKGNSAAWKSGLLALSLTTVFAGTAMIARLDSSLQVAQQPATEQPVQRVVVLQQQPSGEFVERRDTSAGSFSTFSRATIPTMPQQPVFRQPLTRTRGS